MDAQNLFVLTETEHLSKVAVAAAAAFVDMAGNIKWSHHQV